jgi:hypothetical protein
VNTVLEIAKPSCVADDFGGEIVVLNIATGMYYSLRNLAAAVWRDLTAGCGVERLLAELEEINEAASAATAKFVGELQSAGLLRRGPSPLNHAAPLESPAFVASGEVMPILEGFEDMKEFILSDPIHDADDLLGWPAPRMNDS